MWISWIVGHTVRSVLVHYVQQTKGFRGNLT